MLVSLLFLLLPVAATCGWFAGQRLTHKPLAPKLLDKLRRDYFRGLNYLINEQPDKAVDVFIKLLEVDSDTVETHLALGSLFRRRGEVDRAIRVHQNLIARPQLAKQYRLQALSALGQDYLRAGVLDRAERLFLQLVELGEKDQASLHFLLEIYQQEKDWNKAIKVAEKLQTQGEAMVATLAQYHCELAEQMISKGRVTEALQCLKRAESIHHACVRANIIRGRLEVTAQRYKEAIRYYKRVIAQDADYICEVIAPLASCYQYLGAEDKWVKFLEDCLSKYSRISLVLAVSDYIHRQQGSKIAIEFVAEKIQYQPSLRGLSHLVDLYLLNSEGNTKEKLFNLHNLMHKLLANKAVYQCLHCGFAGKTLYWLCPSCHHWNTVKPIRGLEVN